jgi:plasmid stability protein
MEKKQCQEKLKSRFVVFMSVHSVTLSLPKNIYYRLRKRAENSRTTVEMELLDVIAAALSAGDELPDRLVAAITGMNLLDDEALWRAARILISVEQSTQMETLHIKRQREGLNVAEEQTLAGLVNRYERNLLVRSQAAALLKARRYDVSSLLLPA